MQQRDDGISAQVSAAIRTACPDWRIVRAWPLPGAVSARVTALDVEEPGGVRRLVAREYGAANLRAEPDAASTEYRLLRLLHAAGLPVPRPYHAHGQCLLIEFIDGERMDDPPDLDAFVDALAQTLATVHELGCTRADVPFLADVSDAWAPRKGTGATVADDALSETAIRAALSGSWPPARANAPVILHGDYWPGNALWRDGRLAGIVDWEDAMFGDPLADVAVARQELQWFFGPAAMSQFTCSYLALRPAVDASAQPLWDLRAALRPAGKMAGWGLSADQQETMITAHRQFVAGALRQLAEPGRRP